MRGVSRRGFLQAGVVAVAGAAVAGQLPGADADPTDDEGDVSPLALTVDNLTVGDMPNPLGIQAAQPRLSWQLQASGVNRSQSAYEIRVGSDPARISRADLWRSGRVQSGQTRNVEYGGRPLASRTQAYWQVRSWDEAGRVSAWSDV